MIQIRTATEDDFAAISDQRVRSYLDGGHLRPEDSYVETLADVAAHASELLKVAVDSAHPDQVLGSVIMVRPEDDASEPLDRMNVNFACSWSPRRHAVEESAPPWSLLYWIGPNVKALARCR